MTTIATKTAIRRFIECSNSSRRSFRPIVRRTTSAHRSNPTSRKQQRPCHPFHNATSGSSPDDSSERKHVDLPVLAGSVWRGLMALRGASTSKTGTGMTEHPKISPFTLGVFTATLCPIGALIGMVLCGIAQGARIPFEDAAFDAALYVLGFLVTATIGYAVATGLLPAARSKLLGRRSWRLPVVCGVAVSCAATLIEQTTDVLGGFIGHQHGNLMLAGSAIFWSAMATAMVLGIDALIFRWSTKKSLD